MLLVFREVCYLVRREDIADPSPMTAQPQNWGSYYGNYQPCWKVSQAESSIFDCGSYGLIDAIMGKLGTKLIFPNVGPRTLLFATY